MKRAASAAVRILAALAFFIVVAFGAAGVWFCATVNLPVRAALCTVVLASFFFPFLFGRSRRGGIALPVLVLLSTYGWYFSLEPKMDAEWQTDVALLPEVEIGDRFLTVRNFRNFRYRSETDFEAEYSDKTFDLDEIRSVDLFLSYWGTTSIAHTIMSFGFGNGDYLPVSIETRKEVREEYSAVQGFFKKYELFYVLADERDLIGLRVNHRNEDVFLYRLKINPEQARKMLLNYMRAVDELERRAVFYNALTTNCTTSILPHIRAFRKVGFNWALIANGNLDRWRYEEGVWGFEIPFEEFRRRSNVNERVRQAGSSPEFSALIRQGLPSIK